MTTMAKVGIGLGALALAGGALITDGSAQPSSPSAAQAESGCHPSYSGCLKRNAGDYDCRGGSGNGPNYTGRVRVIGPDVFGLDRDRDGWGCE